MCKNDDRIYLETNPVAYYIKDKMENNNARLGDISEIILGLGIQSFKCFRDERQSGDMKMIRGNDIQRYKIRGCLYFSPDSKELRQFQDEIKKLSTPHIAVQRIVSHIRDHLKITAAYDGDGSFSFNTVTNIIVNDSKINPKYVLALLNSKLISYYAYKFLYNNAIRSMDFYKAYAEKIPVRRISEKKQKAIADLVDRMVDLGDQLGKMKYSIMTASRYIKLGKELKETENRADNMIYEIYSLDKNEIDTIEKSYK